MVELQQIYMQNLICITKQISQYKQTFVQVKVTLRQSNIQLVARSFMGKIFSESNNW